MHPLPEKVSELLARDELKLSRARKDGTKEVEIRRFIKWIRLERESLLLRLLYTGEGTARPEEVLEALGCREGLDYRRAEIVRTHVDVPS